MYTVGNVWIRPSELIANLWNFICVCACLLGLVGFILLLVTVYFEVVSPFRERAAMRREEERWRQRYKHLTKEQAEQLHEREEARSRYLNGIRCSQAASPASPPSNPWRDRTWLKEGKLATKFKEWFR